MPIDENILGFSNRWYKDGFHKAISYRVDDLNTVKIFSSPYFVASKLEAFKGRGKRDGRFSHDFEDIVYVLNNIYYLAGDGIGSIMVKDYLKKEFQILAFNPHLEEWISCHLDFYEQLRAGVIVEAVKNFVDLP